MTDTDSFNISYMAVSIEYMAQLILYHGKVILSMYTDMTALFDTVIPSRNTI